MALKEKHCGCRLWVCLVGLSFLAGCSGGGVEKPKTVPVSGTVTYNNQPVEGATVNFMAEGASRKASGVTDKDGKFQLSTFEPGDGAVIGEHVVTITKMEAGAAAPTGDTTMPDAASTAEMMAKEAEKKSGPKSLLPTKYGNPNTSPLKEKVTEAGPNSFVFPLAD